MRDLLIVVVSRFRRIGFQKRLQGKIGGGYACFCCPRQAIGCFAVGKDEDDGGLGKGCCVLSVDESLEIGSCVSLSE